MQILQHATENVGKVMFIPQMTQYHVTQAAQTPTFTIYNNIYVGPRLKPKPSVTEDLVWNKQNSFVSNKPPLIPQHCSETRAPSCRPGG